MTTQRNDDWVTLAAVRASIGDFLDQVGAEPLRIDCGHTRLHVTRAGRSTGAAAGGRTPDTSRDARS